MTDSEKPEGDIQEADGVDDGEDGPEMEMERIELGEGEPDSEDE